MFRKYMNITQWSKATTSIGEAMLSLMNCLHYGYNAYSTEVGYDKTV